jgi:glycosyltransferase involved in cell wall biosynthesis
LKYDVVIASSGPITIGVPGLIGRYLRRKRFFFEVRDLWPEGAVSMGMLNNKLLQKLAWWFEGLCYKASEGVIALSPGMKESIVRRYPKTRTYVMPNASDVELFNNPKYQVELPDWAKGKKLFLYTGTLGKMDDCSQILKGAKVINDQGRNDIIIVFLGDGNEKQHLQEMAKEMGLTNVHFIGMRPKEQVVGWLKHAVATFVVFKNIRVWDTCSPNKMFDAFAAGVPLIQTTQGWIKELFATENCGINVDPESSQEMADAITALADNSELRNIKAANARRLGEQYFNRTKIAREMLDVITSTR